MDTSSQSHNANNNYEVEIDNIINSYKSQLEVIKTTSSINNPIPSQNLSQSTSLPLSNDLSLEIQNDNLKLQSQLNLYKSQLLANKKEIRKLTEKVSSLEKEKIEKEKEYNNTIQALQHKNASEIENLTQENLNTTSKTNIQTQLMKDNVQYNTDIIHKFFNFYNNNVDLFTKAQILSIGSTDKVQYDINNKDKNISSTEFVIQTMNMFIKKLMTDNSEMFNQLEKYKEMVDNQNQRNDSFQEQNIRDVKYENMLLKQQIHSLVEQLNAVGGDKGRGGQYELDKKGMNRTSKKKFLKKRSGSSTSGGINMNNNYVNMNVSGNLNGLTNKQKYEIEPIKKLKLKIKNLEDKIKGSEIDNNDE